MQHILSTGNLCSREVLDYLRGLTGDVHIVRGDFDDDPALTKNPDTKVITIGHFRVGIIHGHQIVPWGSQESLSQLASQLEVDILVSGHSHVVSCRVENNRLFLNPGSATGAFTPLKTDQEIIPSFILIDVQGESASVYAYRLVEDQVKVERFVFKKPVPTEL